MSNFRSELKTKVLKISDSSDFNILALSVFQHQYQNNEVYRLFVNSLCRNVDNIKHFSEIPFLPIELYKTQSIVCKDIKPVVSFESSGTSGQKKSIHLVEDVDFYKNISAQIFTKNFGVFNNKVILGLLPSYLERKNSSLVFMVNHFMELTKNKDSGFYLNNTTQLYNKLLELSKLTIEVILFGVTFALIDFCNKYKLSFPSLKIIETGGMKGRGKELIREELNAILKNGFGVSEIYSEYGMTELLSQSYSSCDKKFQSPPWMKILVRDIYDPLSVNEIGKGVINIIDLANIDTCSFIATDDIGESFGNNLFDIQGRVDYTEIRGCSLLSI